jgi:hypothetical protein
MTLLDHARAHERGAAARQKDKKPSARPVTDSGTSASERGRAASNEKGANTEDNADDCHACCTMNTTDKDGNVNATPLCCCGHATAASRKRCLARTLGIACLVQVGALLLLLLDNAPDAMLGPVFGIGGLCACFLVEVSVGVAWCSPGSCCPVVAASEPEPPLANVLPK